MTLVATWSAAIADARARDDVLTLKGYCAHDDCPTRDVTMYVKDYDTTLEADVSQRGVRCPVCRRVLEFRSVTTSLDEPAVTSLFGAEER